MKKDGGFGSTGREIESSKKRYRAQCVVGYQMIGQGGWNGPDLQVGQVWDLGDQQIVITGLKGEMTEYQACSSSKAMRIGRGHLATVAEIRKRLAAANATLVDAPSRPM